MKIKKSFTPVVLPILALLLVVTSMYASFVSNGVQPAVAASNVAAQPVAPNSDWIEPIDVSNESWYDNTSDVAASPLNGGVTVVWEQRDERPPDQGGHTFGRIRQASNTIVNGGFNLQSIEQVNWKEIGNAKVASDSLGRRHVMYYRYSGSNTCIRHAIV